MTTFPTYARAKTRARKSAGALALGQLTVPVNDPIFGIKLTDLTTDVVVKVPKSTDMRNSDSIRLYWNGVQYGDPVDLSAVDLTDPLIVDFDLLIKVADFPADGTDTKGPVDYEIYDTASEDGQLSGLPVTVRFDRRAPGGSHLPPLYFTPEQLTGITVADLVGGVLTLKVDPYFDGASQDIVELWLGSSPTVGSYLTPPILVADPALEQPVTITQADLEALIDGPMTFGYRVTDWAGNVSALSELVTVNVFLRLPDLLKPLVPENDKGLITYTDAVDDVGVVIPQYNGLAVGDMLYVVWGGTTIDPYLVPSPVPSPPDPVATIAVPYTTVNTVGNGTVQVSYWLQRSGSPRIDSPSTPVEVDLTTPGGGDPDPDPETPEHDNIKAPEVRCGTSPVNTISPDDYGKDATATIFRVGEDLDVIWAVGDVIQMQWGSINDSALLPPVTVTAANQGANIPITVPFTGVIDAAGVGTISVFFTITRLLAGGIPVTVKSKVQSVDVVSSGALPGDGNPLVRGEFPEANASNIITRAKGIDGTWFEITLSGVSNIELTKNPTVSYDFVGVASGDATDPSAPPIEASRVKADNVPLTQAHLTAGKFEVQLPYALTYNICRNGAILDYKLSNDSGTVNAVQRFVRFAMNQGGGTCSLPV